MLIKMHDIIQRISYMEECFDCLSCLDNLNLIYEDEYLKNKVNEIVYYYESGLWLNDYKLDEKHMLPINLKRGVLSQDAVYNFLEQIDISML